MREHRSISIADQIFEQLEKDILSGKYKRGDILNETRLSEELGVSRTPVREAIRRLEQENIIEDTSKGLTVIGISHEDMPDMYEIRLHIETLATERAAENITDEALKEMADVIDMQYYYTSKQKAQQIDNSDSIKDFDSRFHEIIYEQCGSKPFADLLIPLHKRMIKFRKASVTLNSRAEASCREHTEIFEALKAHDGKKAGELMRIHLINARDSISNIKED